MNEGQELVDRPETAIQPFSKFDEQIADFKEMNSKMKFDIETYEGETECKKYLAQIGKVRTGVESLRKSIKKEFLDKGRAVDDEAKTYQAIIAEIDAVHSVPLKALETKRLNEVLEAQEAIKAKEREEEKARIADLEAREAEVTAKAAELKEKEEAVNATKVAQDLEEAKLTAANNAVVAEQVRVEAERQKVLDEQLAREADAEHRKAYNNLALDAIVAVTGDPASSLRLVKAIVKNEIPNVTLNY